MTKKRPHLLLTNDDGITASGLLSLWRGLSQYVDVTIVAPSSDQSGKGVGITILHPLRVAQIAWRDDSTAYHINGTPADCVKLALNVLLERPPDMIVSGINRGSNSGRNVLYSGTIGGVIEGTMHNIPGIAFSCRDFEAPQFTTAEPFIYPFILYLLEHPLTLGSFLNVTFPDYAGPIRGVRLAQQGQSCWIGTPEERLHPSGERYYWLGNTVYSHDQEHHESDVELLRQGYITAVPLRVHQLTDEANFQKHKTSFEEWFSNHPERGN